MLPRSRENCLTHITAVLLIIVNERPNSTDPQLLYWRPLYAIDDYTKGKYSRLADRGEEEI